MRLKNKNESPPRLGFVYQYEDGFGRIHFVNGRGGSFDRLRRAVELSMIQNKVPVPANIADIIEDWICSQIAPENCYYTSGLGDKISHVIHAGARVIDNMAGTQLETKARGCSSCGKRRMKLNS